MVIEDIIWMPQPGSQLAFITCPHWEVLYEGTRGPGKTDALIMDFAQHIGKGFGPSFRGIIFRESYPQLADVISRTKQYFNRLFPKAQFNATHTKWVFEGGEELLFRQMKNPDDYWNYHGHEYPWIGWEELTNWPTRECYDSMKACNRCSKDGVPIRYRATCNPWGVGHSWVKKYFIDPAPPMTKILNESGQVRLRIHGSVYENRVLMRANPDYIKNLESIDDPHKRKAWLEGSWDIAAGGFFEGLWDPDKHIINPFTIPKSWGYILGMDWGSQRPCSIGLWAKSDGNVLPDGRVFPRGSLIRVDEIYTAEKDSRGQTIADKGMRLENSELAKMIFEFTKDKNMHMFVADPACFRRQSGPSIIDQFNKVVKLPFRPADNERIPGWQRVVSMMSEAARDEPEYPGLWIFSNCREWIRTVPVLMRDEKDVEDIETNSEDHAGDETRYVCQTVRPPAIIKPLLI